MTHAIRYGQQYQAARRQIGFRRKELAFEPNRLSFNLSFLTRDHKYNFESKGFDKAVKGKLFDKLVRLSSDRYTTVLSWPKEVGLERLPERDVRLTINPEFIQSRRYQECLREFWIFRLAKSGRVIGKLQETTFYVLGVDTSFSLYQH